MKYLLITLSILATACVFAQQKRDTIYFDRTWTVTKQVDSAAYYRIIKEADNLYRVSDHYMPSDSVQMTGAFKDYAQTIKEGEFIYYTKNGRISSKASYKDGQLDGQKNYYNQDGSLSSTESFVKGINHGDFIVYYESGVIQRKETYENGVLKFKACYLENGKKTKYFPSDIPASYPHGGMEGVKKYIAQNLKYPKEAVEKKIEGKVYVQFVISTSGEITNVKVRKGVDPILDDEAVRVVKAMPDWKPGKINGKPVNSTFSLPITFSLRK